MTKASKHPALPTVFLPAAARASAVQVDPSLLGHSTVPPSNEAFIYPAEPSTSRSQAIHIHIRIARAKPNSHVKRMFCCACKTKEVMNNRAFRTTHSEAKKFSGVISLLPPNIRTRRPDQKG
ncbi:hypothetical protein EJ03DRAFT_384725 [Teratosphaeria nubilosa]|uniref:Uncharacterized protein n=1 Tax=Teratosphaeria nubilosa TaxID=161662 RepID=A0A6G1L077_9PEZI|nr:hypothetical protein EJ03DRAFT_384725 [Teratosphaeria nubilosa]